MSSNVIHDVAWGRISCLSFCLWVFLHIIFPPDSPRLPSSFPCSENFCGCLTHTWWLPDLLAWQPRLSLGLTSHYVLRTGPTWLDTCWFPSITVLVVRVIMAHIYWLLNVCQVLFQELCMPCLIYFSEEPSEIGSTKVHPFNLNVFTCICFTKNNPVK